jgi:hypothetical protein
VSPREAKRRGICFYLTIAPLAGLVLVSGCLSKPISTEDAAKLVRESAAFTRPKFAHIPRLITFQGYFSSPYGTEGVLSITDLARIDPTVAILKLSRNVNVSESIYGPGRGAMHRIVVTPVGIDSASLLADEAPHLEDVQENIDAQEERPPMAAYGWNRVQREIGWRVPIGTRELLHVDRIHNWRDVNENIPVNEVAVDFTWRWVPNASGDAFDSESETFRSMPDSVQDAARSFGARMNTGAAMQSRAYLRRDGDRWQLHVIQWSYGRGNPR